MERMQGREGALVLVNGQHQPAIPAVPQATQQWRIVNTCVARVLSLRLEGHPLVQIAHDGTYLRAPAPHDRLVLPPGSRADVLVTPTGTGRFTLATDPYDRGTIGGMRGGGTPAAGPITVATLVSSGAPAPTPALPAALPAEPAPPPATAERTITFQMDMGGTGGGMGMAFTIDGRRFDPARTDQHVTAGTTEDWTVRNNGPLAHPFHLHAWPFTVVERHGESPPTHALRGCRSGYLGALPAPIALLTALTALTAPRDLAERDPSSENSCQRSERRSMSASR
jgi:FtsP/CotA-like multicopper oxidase with cupredoxin domain